MQATEGIDSAGGPEGGAHDDRGRALEWASSARGARHEVREQLGAGRRSLADVLAQAHRDELIAQVKLLWTLESLPGARKVDTRRTLAAMGLDEARRLGTLDTATTEQLLAAFAAPVPEGGRS